MLHALAGISFDLIRFMNEAAPYVDGKTVAFNYYLRGDPPWAVMEALNVISCFELSMQKC